jgi:hypothetical protein
MDDDDAGLFAVRDVAEPAFLALEIDLAGIVAVRIDAAQHLHEGGLACPVLAHHRVDLARAHHEIDIVQGIHAREGLGDAAHLQDRSGRRAAVA